jgi:hypothetical protein
VPKRKLDSATGGSGGAWLLKEAQLRVFQKGNCDVCGVGLRREKIHDFSREMDTVGVVINAHFL